MIAKAFQKFSFTSAGISSLLLLVVTYYYLTLEIKWSFVESKIFNGVLIYGALMLSNYAIDTVTRQLTIERSSSCLLYTSPSPRDGLLSRMPSSA